jgi:hypothetical protein
MHPGNSVTDREHRHWTREPLVWLLITIPASAVVMGAVMITLALQSFSGMVVDDYYRKGKQINRVLARDRLAYELGLAAGLSVDGSGRLEIRFAPEVKVIPGEHIELRLVHATRPGLDRDLIFDNNGLYLQAELQIPGPGRWNVYLQTPDWRLTGSLQYPQTRYAQLLPNYLPANQSTQ